MNTKRSVIFIGLVAVAGVIAGSILPAAVLDSEPSYSIQSMLEGNSQPGSGDFAQDLRQLTEPLVELGKSLSGYSRSIAVQAGELLDELRAPQVSSAEPGALVQQSQQAAGAVAPEKGSK